MSAAEAQDRIDRLDMRRIAYDGAARDLRTFVVRLEVAGDIDAADYARRIAEQFQEMSRRISWTPREVRP